MLLRAGAKDCAGIARWLREDEWAKCLGRRVGSMYKPLRGNRCSVHDPCERQCLVDTTQCLFVSRKLSTAIGLDM